MRRNRSAVISRGPTIIAFAWVEANKIDADEARDAEAVMKIARLSLLGPVAAVTIFLLMPIAIVIVASINSAEYLSFPPAGVSIRW